MLKLLKALFVTAFNAFRDWRRDHERDILVATEVRKDVQIADQAAAIHIRDVADSVPRTLPTAREKSARRGRRKPDG